MEKLLLTIFLLLAFSCSKSQVKIPGSIQDNEEWAAISYNFNAGPVSQQYQYNYIVTISSEKTCAFLFNYSDDLNYTREFSISETDFNKLTELLKSSRILEVEIASDPTAPLSTNIRYVSIVFKQSDANADRPPKMITAPNYPAVEFKNDLDNLYDYIESLIPEGIKKEAEDKREEYSKNKKKLQKN
jgi:hypothetical protein